jgi:hypothetical protein
MSQARTNLIFLLSLATALLCLGTVFFFLHVISDKNEHSSDVLATLENKIEQKNDVSLVHKQVAEIQADDDMVTSHFVDPTKINAFVDYLGAFGTNTNTQIAVKDIKLAPKDKNSIITSISIVGAFSDVEKSITLLENDTYQIHITNLTLGENAPAATPPVPTTLKSKGAVPPPVSLPIWEADISFSVLSS